MSGSTSIRRTDLLALSNLRNDGRKPHEIRRLRMRLGCCSSSSSNAVRGSAVVEMGLTTVLAVVTGPLENRGSGNDSSSNSNSMLEVTLNVAPFAVPDRRTFNARTDRRLMESALQIQRALETAVLQPSDGGGSSTRLAMDITVLADDGGRLCAAVNAATLALLDAGIPLKDFVCACSAGSSSSSGDSTTAAISVDLNRREENALGGGGGGNTGGGVYLPIAILPQRGTLVLAQCEARLPDFDALEMVLDAAMEGCRTVFLHMQAAVKEHAATLLAARQGQASVVCARME